MNAQPTAHDAGRLNGVSTRGIAPSSSHEGENGAPVLFQQLRQQHQALLEDSHQPDSGAIELKAYEIYLEDGCQEGRALDHWLEAERRLQAES